MIYRSTPRMLTRNTLLAYVAKFVVLLLLLISRSIERTMQALHFAASTAHYRCFMSYDIFLLIMLRRLTCSKYDDHDVVNNFDMGEHARPYPIANQAFEAYQGMSNPTPRKPGQTWYTYEYGGVDFFMLDTRRFRSRNRDRDGPEKTMLGEEQLSELLTWLSTASDSHFKIIISSIPFTENWKGVDGKCQATSQFSIKLNV